MFGKLIDWTFDLLGSVWNGFWNVFGKLFGLLMLTLLSGAIGAAILKIAGGGPDDAWHFFKCGAFIGFLIGSIRLLINEVAVPMLHTQEKRERERRRREIDALARRDHHRESVSNRLKLRQ